MARRHRLWISKSQNWPKWLLLTLQKYNFLCKFLKKLFFDDSKTFAQSADVKYLNRIFILISEIICYKWRNKKKLHYFRCARGLFLKPSINISYYGLRNAQPLYFMEWIVPYSSSWSKCTFVGSFFNLLLCNDRDIL